MGQITLIMPVKNEIKHLRKFEDAFMKGSNWLGTVLVMDDNSTDGSDFFCDTLSKKYSNFFVYKNQHNLSFNEIVIFLTSKVKTKYVHIRSPHDVFPEIFYFYHLDRLSRHPHAKVSASKAENLSTFSDFDAAKMDLNPFLSKLFIKFFDPNISSCGFVAETETFLLLWRNFSRAGRVTDWFVKKSLLQNNQALFSFKILSCYNDMNSFMNEPNEQRTLEKHELLATIFDHYWPSSQGLYYNYPN